MSIWKDFRDFAFRGNVIDLAVGIIIGAAFGKIVASLVSDVIMPPIGALLGGVNFTDIVVHIKNASLDPATGKIVKEAVNLRIGSFIQALVDFTIIAFAIFLLVKLVNKFSKKKELVPPPPPGPTKDQELLTEIRDLLKK